MKAVVVLFLLMVSTSVFALDIDITSPKNNATYAADVTKVKVSGTIQQLLGSIGEVVCDDGNLATFTSNKAWSVDVPIVTGSNTITCVYSKDKLSLNCPKNNPTELKKCLIQKLKDLKLCLTNSVPNPLKCILEKTTKTASDSVTVIKLAGNNPPVANFSFDSTDLIAPASISFNSNGSSDTDGNIVSYDWKFGDGGTGSGPAVSHVYQSAGNYTVTLKVTDNTSKSTEISKTISIVPNKLPISKFTISPLSPIAPVEITFDGSSSSDQDGTISTYKWIFSDGSTALGKVVKKNFTGALNLNVSLLVTDNKGGTNTTSQQVVITVPASQPPVANINFYSGNLLAPVTIDFDSEGSRDIDGNIVSYIWDFGDGTTSTESNTDHTFQTPGTYLVKLRVMDNSQITSEITKSIQIFGEDENNESPYSDFTASPMWQRIDRKIVFDASDSEDSDGEILFYFWDFGDGTRGSGKTIEHTYSEEGDYEVSLTVIDDKGYPDIFEDDVRISATNILPIAQMVVSPSEINAGSEVNFNASSSREFDGNIVEYIFDFGDGSPIKSQASPIVSHTYQNAGSFSATLKVKDNDGGISNTFSSPVKVNAPNIIPVASFSISPSTIRAGQIVLFNGSSSSDSDGQVVEYQFDFGDGTSLVSQSAPSLNHTFNIAGTFNVTLRVKDNRGSYSNGFSKQVTVLEKDINPPFVQLALSDNILTKINSISVPVTVSDESTVTTKIWLNGIVVFQTSSLSFSQNIILTEGLNLIQIESIDEFNNKTSIYRSNIVLDTVAPTLANIIPSDGSVYSSLNIPVSAQFNEPLASLEVNGNVVNIDPNSSTFNFTLIEVTEGNKTVEIKAVDKVGNTSTYIQHYSISSKILRKELITVVPSAGGRLKVIGATGSVDPGLEVEVDGGWFNSNSSLASEDGSFVIEIDYFNSATVTAYDQINNREESVEISFNVDTTLSGTVRDPDGRALVGATVTIAGSGQVSTVNSQGTFSISSPVLGDQKLIIDGTTVLSAVTEGTREYSKVSLNITIGRLQQNIIDRTIYISPKLLDGTETQVVVSDGATVSSPHAPGVTLEIQGGVTKFPGGANSGAMNLMEIDAQKTSIELPDGVVPSTVIALEPSGTKFDLPVKVTLPNNDEYPNGMEMVILSKNSDTGMWEIDGGAVVNGDIIETKEGQGITHFSEIFAVPFGMEIKAIGEKDRPSIDGNLGNLTTTVDLPSFQRLGNKVQPTLKYQSNWASPHAVVTNMFNFPRKYFERTAVVAGANVSFIKKIKVRETIESWLTPDSIKSHLIVGPHSSPEISINAAEAPDQALITYGVDLKNLDSGVYPSQAEYEIRYKSLVLRTLKIEEKDLFSASTKKITSVEQDLLESVFPPELRSTVYHQNKLNSEFGSGWKFAAIQKIVNPSDDRIMIENEDGSISPYVLDNKLLNLVTVAKGVESLSTKNDKIFYSDEEGSLFEINDEGNSVLLKQHQKYEGSIGLNAVSVVDQNTYCCSSGVFGCTRRCPKYLNQCEQSTYNFQISKKIHGILNLDDSNFLFLDQYGAIYESNNSEVLRAGNLATPARIDISSPNSTVNFQPECQNRIQNDCKPESRVNYTASTFWKDDLPATLAECGGNYRESSGLFPTQGFSNNSISISKFNKPFGMIPSKTNNVIYVADTGNNIVRMINFNSNTITTVAGNQQTFDNGDGGIATQASLYHPRGLAQDSNGSLYISTENGYIRKVSSTGIITTIAGRPLSAGGEYVESGLMINFNFKNPTQLALDETKNLLYVADTGNHRIVQINLASEKAKVIIGNGTCTNEAINEKLPALSISLCSPTQIALDQDKNLIFLDKFNKTIRKIILNPEDGTPVEYASTMLDNSKLIKLPNGNFERQFRHGLVSKFNSLGLHKSNTDLSGKLTSFNYDSNRRLTSITDPTGSVSQLEYSGDLLESFTDPAGRSTYFTYDDKLLSEIEFPDGSLKKFYYNDQNLLIKETNEEGHSTIYEYSDLKKLSLIQKPDSSKIYIKDSQSNNYENTFVGNNTYNLQNFSPLSDVVTNTSGVSHTFVKSSDGTVASVLDGESKETKIERDSFGRPVKIIRPDLTYSEFTYDPNTGDLIKKFESSTESSEFFAYNERGQLTQYTDPNGKVSVKTYDSQNGLLLTETDSRGVQTSRTYQSLGLLKTVSNALGVSESYEYDSNGNLTKLTKPSGETTIYTRDSSGNVMTLKDSKNQVRQFTYDFKNNLLTVLSSPGNLTSYEYTPGGLLKKVVAPNNTVTSYEYNLMGKLVKKQTPAGQTFQYDYNIAGNLTQEIQANGVVKKYEYDAFDRLIKKILPEDTVNLTYNTDGLVETISNSTSQLTYSYSNIHGKKLPTQIAVNSFDFYTLNYSYDLVGNKTEFNSPWITTSYSRDDSYNISSVSNSHGWGVSYSWDLANNLKSIARSNGVNSDLTYDSSNFLKEIIHKKGSATLASQIYQRDSIFNITEISTLRGSQTFQYNPENQLTSATQPEGDSLNSFETFNYDSLGNRTSDRNGNYTYNSSKYRLEEDWKYLYSYDQNGNLISKQEKNFGLVHSYSYNSNNQLISINITEPSGNSKSISYRYDALGRRINKSITDSVTGVTKERKYIYDGNEIIAELDEETNLLATYTHSGIREDDIVSMHSSSNEISNATGSYSFLKDSNGSVLDIINSSGTVVQHYAYSSFGKILKIENDGIENSNNPNIKLAFTFTGREYDSESGLYYYRARYYDSHSGRFLQEDTFPGSLNLPSSFNSKYAYCGNNPINFRDPSGKVFGLDDFLIAVAVSAVVNAVIASAVADGDFFDNLFGEVGQTAAIKGIITANIVIGGALIGSAFGIGAGVWGGISAGVFNTWVQGKLFATNPGLGEYIMGAGLGAFVGMGVALAAYGLLNSSSGTTVATSISDLNREILGSIFDSGATTTPVKVSPLP